MPETCKKVQAGSKGTTPRTSPPGNLPGGLLPLGVHEAKVRQSLPISL